MVTYLRALLTKRLEQLDERGASAVEYGLLLAGIAIVVMAGIFFLGPQVKSMFEKSGSQLQSSVG